MAASREEIRYDDRSVQALHDQINIFFDEVKQNLEERVEKLDGSFWNQILDLEAISKEVFGSRYALKNFMGDSKNEVMQRYIKQDGSLTITAVSGYSVYMYDRKGYSGTTLSRNKLSSNRAAPKEYVISPDVRRKVFINDVGTGAIKRLTHYYERHSVKDIILIVKEKKATHRTEDSDGNSVFTPYTEADYKKEYDQLMYELGGVHIHSVKDDTENTVVRTNLELNHKGFYQYSGLVEKSNRGYYSATYKVEWNAVSKETDLNNIDGLYVELRNRNKVMITVGDDKSEIDFADRHDTRLALMLKMINQFYGYNFQTTDVYGVNTPTYTKLEKNPDTRWHNLFDLYRNLVPTYMKNIIFFADFDETEDFLDVKTLLNNNKFMRRIYKLDESSLLKQVVVFMHKQYIEFGNDRSAAAAAKRFDHRYGVKLFVGLEPKPFFDRTMLTDRYPMLAFSSITEHTIETEAKALDALFEYITLIDRSLK